MRQFSDVFSWSYEDMKVYDKGIIQHTIPIKEDQKPFRQKLRRINPLLLPLIEKEVRKLFDAKIIVSLRFSKWIANLVPVRKKNGEIRLCIDFRNLNRVSLKDNYPLPKMDHILQNIVGSQRMSCWMGFLDITRSWCTQMTKRRQHLQPHGAPSCMKNSLRTHECRGNFPEGYGHRIC
jgi:hypothetical protein